MKIIQITDTHILGKGQSLYGTNPNLNLKLALKSIKRNHRDADFITISGDLSGDKSLLSYKKLQKITKDYFIPIHLVLGNHDDKKTFNKVFDLCKDDSFVQYTKVHKDFVFIFLDTTIYKEDIGTLCTKRLDFLDSELKKHKNKNAYIIMHHFPLVSGLHWMDKHAYFKDKDKFWNILNKHKNIKHIFTGHLHKIINANTNGVNVSCSKSTNFQVAYTPNSKNDYLTNEEKPSYVVALLEKNSMLIHNHDFLNEKLIYSANYK